MQGSDIVHIACHAEAGTADRPAALLLRPVPTAGDSGVLSDERILDEVRLTPGAFVNLAGCSTADHGQGSGALLRGLVPAFLVAGAGSVAATLWRIDDALALRFQEAFYEALPGHRPADALASVQRACLRGEHGEEMASHEIWAAFVLYGPS